MSIVEESQLRLFILTDLPDDGEWFHDGYEAFIKCAKAALKRNNYVH